MRYQPSRLALSVAAIAAVAGVSLMPSSAKAWVSFGFALPPVVVAPAPVAPYPYYPPPGYYPPPPYYGGAPPATPPQSQPQQYTRNNVPYGATCYAGNYTCAAAPYSPVGTGCSCPGLGAPSYGTVQ